MIDKRYGKFVPVCDGCGEELQPQDTFDEAIAEMRKHGWTTDSYGSNEYRVWSNTCTQCTEYMEG